MDDNTLKLIEIIIVIIGALVPLIKELRELIAVLKDVFRTSNDNENAKKQATKKTKQLAVWLIVIFGTLIVPTGAIISFSMSIISQYLAQTTTDVRLFASQLVSITGAIGVLYPLIWGIYIYPIFRDYFNRQEQNVVRN